MTQNYNNYLTLLKGETTMNVFHLSKKQIKILNGIDKIFLNINRADFLQDRTLEILRDNSCHVLVKRYGVRLVILAAYLQNEPRIIHKRHKIIPPLFLPLLASSRRALSKWCIF